MIRQTISVGVAPGLLEAGVQAALAELVPVEFVPSTGQADVFIGRTGNATQPSFLVAGAAATVSDGKVVRFSDSPLLDQRIRGRSLFNKPVQSIGAIKPEPGDTILACYGETPVWIKRGHSHIVAVPLPTLKSGEKALDYFHGDQFIQLLPLLHFLREATAGLGWTKPPLRACLMVDDPNLHWTSYGFLPYAKVVALAKECHFHLSFATVPLDGWLANERAVNLVRQNPGQLSLVVHGNDHLIQELGRARSHDDHLQLFAQSLRRISRLEQRSGLHVARVMAPPHGAFAEAGCPAMLEVGYEGACVSPWSLQDWNPDRQWPPAFGLQMTELMAGGFPAVPRFRLSSTCEGPIVISAFLDRPIIPVCHHDALADGLDLFARVAATINSLGPVQWGSPQMMLRSNSLTRRDGNTVWIKPFSARLAVTVPAGVNTLVLAGEATQEWRLGSRTSPAPSGTPIRVAPGSALEITSTKLGVVDYQTVKEPAGSPWALPRRILCEARDRVAPIKHRLTARAT